MAAEPDKSSANPGPAFHQEAKRNTGKAQIHVLFQTCDTNVSLYSAAVTVAHTVTLYKKCTYTTNYVVYSVPKSEAILQSRANQNLSVFHIHIGEIFSTVLVEHLHAHSCMFRPLSTNWYINVSIRHIIQVRWRQALCSLLPMEVCANVNIL